jgi:deoxyribodipyrimidine photolyase-related protein
MTVLRFILGDQLSRSMSSLADLDPERDTVLMVEVHEEAVYVRHHKQKIALVLSAMRHFAEDLRREGVRVDYVRLDDRANTGAFGSELKRAIERLKLSRVVVTEPGEWRVWEMMQDWREELDAPVEIRADSRFLCSRAAFARWAEGRDHLRMEAFYRAMRERTGFLMDGHEPAGGRWNFDADNRKRLPSGIRPPLRRSFKPDATTRAVRARFWPWSRPGSEIISATSNRSAGPSRAPTPSRRSTTS